MFEKFKTYAKITKVWSIARRYFVNNFYDGMLTVLGILLGFFIIVLETEPHSVSSRIVVLTGIGSSISMFISGSTSSYLSERAEQRKLQVELYKAMIVNEFEDREDLSEESKIEEIEKAMLIRLKEIKKKKTPSKIAKNNRKKNIMERAELFTIIVVTFVNGFSPFLGGIIALIPFMIEPVAVLNTFIYSFVIILTCIIMLGVFLGVVSKESIIKNIVQMLLAFVFTIIILIILLR